MTIIDQPNQCRTTALPHDGRRTSAGTTRLRAWRALERTLSQDATCAVGEFCPDQAEIARLNAALRRERALGRAGHWAYDMNRHIALLQRLRAAGALARK